ncbi:MAG: hypothetical protein H6712_30195 [Myxococcales bacterium]|nr:hypothetical protein [Myxococcales bacterium]MCB9718159.1 hypothetical protein [Myxococcales bacterium]
MAYLKIVSWGALVLLASACTVEPEEGETTGITTSGSTGDATNVTITTISSITTPTATEGATDDSQGTSGSSTSDGGGSTSTGSVDESGTTTDEPGTTTDEPGTSEDTGPETYDVGWCNLQYPPSVSVAVSEAWTNYVRVYAAGLTDQSGVTDPDPMLVVELGYGLDGSDPSMGIGAPWTYVSASPNGGYGPGAPGYSAINDEYMGDLQIDMEGIYDYAARISGDGGTTWVWCDIDGLSVGGYTPDQAGNAEVGQ